MVNEPAKFTLGKSTPREVEGKNWFSAGHCSYCAVVSKFLAEKIFVKEQWVSQRGSFTTEPKV